MQTVSRTEPKTQFSFADSDDEPTRPEIHVTSREIVRSERLAQARALLARASAEDDEDEGPSIHDTRCAAWREQQAAYDAEQDRIAADTDRTAH